jgi:hypothetical protein
MVGKRGRVRGGEKGQRLKVGIQGGLSVGKRGRAKVWGKWVRHKGEGLMGEEKG